MFIQNQEQHYFHGDGRSLKQCRTFEVNLHPSYSLWRSLYCSYISRITFPKLSIIQDLQKYL